MVKCFDGHTSDHPGCIGCHYAFHVKQPGKVEGGKLVPPVVDGPEECELCHHARHSKPVPGCPRCDAAFVANLAGAELAARPARQEIAGLKALNWILGWRGMAISWLAILGGGAAGGWFRRPNGSANLAGEVFFIFGVPLVQWRLRRQIRRRRRQLPQLTPTGEIVFGDEAGQDSDKLD
jgi:hypothetical protein